MKNVLSFLPKTGILKFISVLVLILGYTSVKSQSNLTVVKPKIMEYKLKNGLTVILNEDHSQSVVFGVVVTKAGSKNDPADAQGMAHYQEHMLFKGTQEIGTTDWEKEKPFIEKTFQLYDELGKTKDELERKKIQQQINEASLEANKYAIPNELSNIIKIQGGTNLNANTSNDRTVYFNAFPPSQINKWLELYSHRFMNPVFRSFQSELEVVYEEKNLYNDIFFMPIIEKFNKNFFKKHPYGQQSVIGSVESLKNPSLTKMYDFFKTYYVANNMALIISGDFDSESIKTVIEEKFGRMQTGVIPQFPEYKEEPFNGRELVEVKMSPIKVGLLGFRSPSNSDKDRIAMDVCNGILSNQNQTGLIDQLILDNKLMMVGIIPFNHNDYGEELIYIFPKIVGQSLENAEQLVLGQIEKLHKGEFDDWMLDAVKNQIYKDYQKQMESVESRAVLFAETFGQNRKIEDAVNYPEQIKKITKEDVIRVSKQYYGKNYLAFFSKMGFPKKEKILKPDYKPVLANVEAKSDYAKKLEEIKTIDSQIRFVDFNNDVKTINLSDNSKLYYVENKKNDIFTATIKFGIGDDKMPELKYASQIMNFAGTKTFALKDLKKEFSKIGCSYNIRSDKSFLYLELEGLDNNFEAALKLTNDLIVNPVVEKSKIKNIIENEKGGRKMENSDASNVAEALFEYVKHKNKSDYLDRFSMKKIAKLNPDSLVSSFKKATLYTSEIHYVGQGNIENITKIFAAQISSVNKKENKTSSPVETNVEKYNENIVYFVNKKKAVQSKIYFFANDEKFNKEKVPFIDAFNLYFGGDFSGLVLQEIREYRSLSYTAGAGFKTPELEKNETCFVGYLGTQADKTFDALEVFIDLVRNMPEKTDRLGMIKSYLTLSNVTATPSFRNLSQAIVNWKMKGYTEDPRKFKIETYNKLSFEQIVDFYSKSLKNKSIVIAIVGDKKRIDVKKLSKYGKVIELKEKELYLK